MFGKFMIELFIQMTSLDMKLSWCSHVSSNLNCPCLSQLFRAFKFFPIISFLINLTENLIMYLFQRFNTKLKKPGLCYEYETTSNIHPFNSRKQNF